MLIPQTDTEYVLDEPSSKIDRAILFVPGMSGGALSEKYSRLAELATASGYALLRTQSWRDTDDLNQKSLEKLHNDLVASLDFLRVKGYTRLSAIGKSLGGALLLYCRLPDFERLVLWAPAAYTSPEGTIDSYWHTPFAQIDSLEKLSIKETVLSGLETKVLFVHGTEDRTVPLEHVEKIRKPFRDAELAQIPGMGHSPKTLEESEELFSLSIDFISKNTPAV